MKSVFKFLKSIRLAVIIIVSLAILSAIGTVVEARYDAEMAKRLVYYSIYMWLIMGALAVNLIAVMVDRWPWKKHHSGFVMAHIGILLTMIGSLFTYFEGIDGSMAFGFGESSRYVTLPQKQLKLYSSFGQSNYELLKTVEKDFYGWDFQKKPVELSHQGETFKLLKYCHYCEQTSKIVKSDNEEDGAALRIQFLSSRIKMTRWLNLLRGQTRQVIPLGPAQVVITNLPFFYRKGNVIVFRPIDNETVKYEIYSERKKGLSGQGKAKVGDVITTGWMDIQVRVITYFPHSRNDKKFIEREFPGQGIGPALQYEYKGEKAWLSFNSFVRHFKDNQVLILQFGSKRVDIGFDMKLEDFEVGRYQGTIRAASYESKVRVKDEKTWSDPIQISMNEPLKKNGLTFYQASFQEDDSGKPIMSILSVNRDPGRGLKYFGSFLLVLGSIMLFYFRKIKRKKGTN